MVAETDPTATPVVAVEVGAPGPGRPEPVATVVATGVVAVDPPSTGGAINSKAHKLRRLA